FSAVGAVIDAGRCVGVEQCDDLGCEVARPGGLTDLIGDDADGVVGGGQPQHRLGEVGPVFSVEPRGAHDVGAFRVQFHSKTFAFGFGATVGRYRVDA